MAKRIQVGGRIESMEVGGIVTGAAEILDDAKGKKQSVINQETDDELARLDQSKQDNLTFDNAPTEGSDNPVKSGGLYTAQQAILLAIAAINELIPSAASTLNQLADKAFVNSSISTNTATFRGTSAAGLTEQQFLAWANGLTHDLNDYVFWQTVDAAGNTLFKRYKWNGTEWAYEYTLNNSTFTAEQWEAIQSGITALLVAKLRALPTAQELIQSFDSKQDVLTFDDVPTLGSTNPVKSSGIYNVIKAITDLVPAEATAQNQLADKADVAAKIVAAIPSWKGQYDALTDLQAVTGAKDGDMGCVKTTDSDGHAVLTFYQYSAQGAWVVYYTLRHYAQNKPATTGTTGDYPYNGMGRIELQKNIVNGVNTLTQAMLTQQNTIYVIQYDFTLGEDITIPENCVLEFKGGSIKGGKITLSSGCTIDGNGAKIETADNTTIGYAIQTQRNTADNIVVRNVNFVGHCSYLTDHETGLCAIEFVESDNVTIEGCSFTGFNKNIELTQCKNVLVTKNVVLDATETANTINGYGVLLEEGSDIIITDNKFYNIERHALYINAPTNVIIEGNYIEGQTDNKERYSHFEGNIKINGARNIVVKNNISIGNYYGIAFLGGFSETGFGCDGVNIEGNVVKDCIVNPGWGFGAISFIEPAIYRNVSITNNVIKNTRPIVNNDETGARNGISIDKNASTEGTYTFDNVKIEGNLIEGFSVGIRISLALPFVLDNNTVIGRYKEQGNPEDIAYFFNTNNIGASGGYNYYRDCIHGGYALDQYKGRYCHFKGFISGSGIVYISGGVSSINAGDGTVFFATSGINIITNIVGGFNGQEITLYSISSGGMQVKNGGNIILKSGDFATTVAEKTQLHLVNVQGTWFESGREFDYSVPSNAVGSTRPTVGIRQGFCFFDTSLSPARPIWYNGTDWVDATGQTV